MRSAKCLQLTQSGHHAIGAPLPVCQFGRIRCLPKGGARMRRGEFISLLGGTVAVWPLSVRVKWRYATPIIFVHLVALLACVPWFFSWTGVVLAVLGAYIFGLLGMNIGYHRLLTHRSFSCPRWMERSLAVVGACCLEESPAVWVRCVASITLRPIRKKPRRQHSA